MSTPSTHNDPSSFLEIDARVCEILRQFRPVAAKALPDILQQFYKHVSKWPGLVAKFGAAEHQKEAMSRAAAAQNAHWQNLFSGTFNQSYIESARRIGRAHATKGIDPRWYIGAYAFISNRIYETVFRESYLQAVSNKASMDKAFEVTLDTVRAVNQAIMLDMALAISVYNDENKLTYGKNTEKLMAECANFVRTVSGLLDEAPDNDPAAKTAKTTTPANTTKTDSPKK